MEDNKENKDTEFDKVNEQTPEVIILSDQEDSINKSNTKLYKQPKRKVEIGLIDDKTETILITQKVKLKRRKIKCTIHINTDYMQHEEDKKEKNHTSIKRIKLNSSERELKERAVPKCSRHACKKHRASRPSRIPLCSVGESRRKCKYEHKRESRHHRSHEHKHNDKYKRKLNNEKDDNISYEDISSGNFISTDEEFETHNMILKNDKEYFKWRSKTIDTSSIHTESKLDTLIKRSKKRDRLQEQNNNYSYYKQFYQNDYSANKLHSFIKNNKIQSNIRDVHNKDHSVKNYKKYSDKYNDFWSSNNEHNRRIDKESAYTFDKTLWDNVYQYDMRRIPDPENATVFSEEMDISIHSLPTVILEPDLDNEAYSPTSPTISITSPALEMGFRNSISTSYNDLPQIQQKMYYANTYFNPSNFKDTFSDNINNKAYSPIMSPDLFVLSPKSNKYSIISDENDIQITQCEIKKEKDLNNTIVIKNEAYDNYNEKKCLRLSTNSKEKLAIGFENKSCNITELDVNGNNNIADCLSFELQIKSEPQ